MGTDVMETEYDFLAPHPVNRAAETA